MNYEPSAEEKLRRELDEARLRIAQLEARLEGASSGVVDPLERAPSNPTDSEFAHILLDTLHEAVVACDARGRLILFNRTAREWHGRDAAPLGPDEWAEGYGLFEADGVTPLARDRIPLAMALSGLRVRDAAMSVRAPGQPLRHMEADAAPFHDARGNLLGAVTTLRDVTTRKTLQRALETDRAQLALAMNMAKLVRWERDLATDVYTLNPAFYALYGTTAEQEGGMDMPMDVYLREFVHPDDRDAVLSAIMKGRTEASSGISSADHRIIRRDGEIRHITVRHTTLLDESGRSVKRVGANQDITERKELESSLETRSAQLALAMDMARLVRWEADPASGTLHLNDQFYALYGTTAEREGGYSMSYERYVREFFHPDDIPLFTQAAMAQLNNSDPRAVHTLVHRIIRRDGEMRHIRVRFFTMSDPGPRRVVGANQDITEQRLAEERLMQTTERLQEAQRIAQVGDWDWEPETGQSFWSDQTYHILGLDPVGPTGTYDTVLRLIHPEDRLPYIDTVNRALATGQPYERELRLVRPDGAHVHLLVRGRPILDESGKVERLHGTVQDITARKQAEEALLESRERLRRFTERVEESLRRTRTVLDQILECMPSALIAVDTRGVVTHWNKCAQELSGMSPAEALGAPLAEAFPWLSGQMASVHQAMQTGSPTGQERAHFAREGETRLLDIMVYPYGEGATEGAVLRLDDVTVRAAIENRMVQTEKMLSVGSLAGGMAHEINNPLSGILQSAQIIRRRLAPGTLANTQAAQRAGCSMEAILGYLEERGVLTFLNAIEQSGRRANAIVRNMLGFIRKSPTLKAPAALEDILERALELASTDYDLKRNFDFRRIRIERHYQADMPDVPCAAIEIEQVVLNLLTNAAHALACHDFGDREPAIALRLLRGEGCAVLEVEDNGPGMDEATRKKIFEPFFTTKKPGEGTGLGLSVSYFIITRNHGGSFSVESRPGAGTRFTIALPLADSQASCIAAP
ncbi:Sensor protein FixL [Fundidesulfovibrio magnetotacticus]|uniref:histidine kinase n=1 Tax=Fundidesulfovibrio magnetotacticus TaxID=2730080 RepID=A0A6V8LT56_9BACT|nr:PAS domain S-box protein [Fundidesulfovibrio magnetotacticus]GFK94140.1 Sensor protein FixL [Fundidesulfovibrio magnetotacticus]